MSPQRFRVEEAGLPGEGVSGIMDERPKVDSGGHAAALRGGLGRHLPITSVAVESMELLQSVSCQIMSPYLSETRGYSSHDVCGERSRGER
jgi:hypothetical protein